MRAAFLSLLTLLMCNFVEAACPTTVSRDSNGRSVGTSPDWSDDIEFVIADLVFSNSMPGDVTFNPQGTPVSDAETLDIDRRGSDPYTYPFIPLSQDAIFKISPAGETYSSGENIRWRVAFEAGAAPAGYYNRVGLQPVDHDLYGTFQFGVVEAEFTCTEGEPFFAEIIEADAGLDEILLTVSAEQGSAAITSYDATCEDTGENETHASSSGTSITVPDLEGGEDYTCTVTATNSVGTSAASDPVEITTLSGGLPVWLMWKGAEIAACNQDSDGDRLGDCYETNTGSFVSATDTGTDPNNADTDGDGISDGDEVLGTSRGLDLPGMGANPLKKTILMEYDWLSDDTQEWYDSNARRWTYDAHNHKPTSAIAGWVEDAFANAPVSNPDGSTGIQIIQDYGQGGLFTGGNEIADTNGNLTEDVFGNDFVTKRSNNFAANRVGYFHYTIFAHRYYDGATDSSGYAELPGDDLIVTSDWWFDYYPDSVASTIVHELGHNLNIRHGGNVNTNNKPNYNSVMNYDFQFAGIDTDCEGCGTDCSNQNAYLISGDAIVDGTLPDGIRARIDFSRGTRADLDETSLDESIGVCSNVELDFNRSGVIDAGLVAADINNDGVSETLSDYDDWSNIYYDGPADAAGAGAGLRPRPLVCDNAPPPIGR